LRPRLAQIVCNGLVEEAYERWEEEEATAEWNRETMRREAHVRGYRRWRFEEACIRTYVKGMKLVDRISRRK
jgi:hypothetical protein